MFQEHNYITHHLYTVLCVHCPKSSLQLSPFITPTPPSPFPTTPCPGNHHNVVHAHEIFPSFFLFCSISPPSPSPSPIVFSYNFNSSNAQLSTKKRRHLKNNSFNKIHNQNYIKHFMTNLLLLNFI